jgi:hypothetical protein
MEATPFGETSIVYGEHEMKKPILYGAPIVGLLSILLLSPAANAGGFIQKSVTCPANNVTIIPVGSRFNIHDIILSTNKDQAVTIKFNPPNQPFIKLFMKGKLYFQTNLRGEVDSEEEQSLTVDCSGTENTTLHVTVTGNGNL